MKAAGSVIAFALLVAACSSSDEATDSTTVAPDTSTSTTRAETTTTTSATTTTAAATSTSAATTTAAGRAQFALSTVGFGDSAMIVITNIGGAPGDLGGHWLCQRPSYYEIPPIELAPLEAVAISAGGELFSPPPGAKVLDDVATIGTLNPESGEIGLYSSNSFGDSDAIVSYVEWGQSGHGRSSVAVSAGIWSEGSFVATDGASSAITALLLPAEDPVDWEIVSG